MWPLTISLLKYRDSLLTSSTSKKDNQARATTLAGLLSRMALRTPQAAMRLPATPPVTSTLQARIVPLTKILSNLILPFLMTPKIQQIRTIPLRLPQLPSHTGMNSRPMWKLITVMQRTTSKETVHLLLPSMQLFLFKLTRAALMQTTKTMKILNMRVLVMMMRMMEMMKMMKTMKNLLRQSMSLKLLNPLLSAIGMSSKLMLRVTTLKPRTTSRATAPLHPLLPSLSVIWRTWKTALRTT